ncbi:MAG: ribosome maturation factor RimM [Azospirillaceae bacterium]|nr:ribosome maturation factor RimM [Azospirillaceae bacterium]
MSDTTPEPVPTLPVPAPADKVCVGAIVGAHGVRGQVKLKSFTVDPAAISQYGVLGDETGQRQFRIALISSGVEHWIARVEGVTDRDQAEALRGTRLYIDRSALPEPEPDEFYHADLIGLAVEKETGERCGQVVALHDFGAGDVVEIALAGGGSALLPFTLAAVPVVDIPGRRIVIDPPVDWLDPPAPPSAENSSGPDDAAPGPDEGGS